MTVEELKKELDCYDDDNGWLEWKYCPHCGAEMEDYEK